jgi:hypothetical protein
MIIKMGTMEKMPENPKRMASFLMYSSTKIAMMDIAVFMIRRTPSSQNG